MFTGASRSLANAYVLILVRAVRRELTLCEHRAGDPAMVKPVFTPDSQKACFVCQRIGTESRPSIRCTSRVLSGRRLLRSRNKRRA